ncbi:hypothetical protein B0F90DRAFT_1627541 [Multifurca ochricompacta]|uniref:Signal recognition particle subunit SRP72 n=1 Tax=Multifurca ochricompacta TaxID=376703 RepID=A0AAD4QPA2_9AGAM|nr:hypothetical protein B0F90DRAFT_1627541 [Multifurca ochricompacta]
MVPKHRSSTIHAAKPVKAQVTQRSTTARKIRSLPKKEISLGDRVQRLFTSLYAQIDGSHFTNAIKTCDKVLRLVPDDNDAKQTKLFLLLHTERYSDALALLGASNESSTFERVYALYRLQHLDEAARLLDEIKEGQERSRGALHLEAQLNYRQGNYQIAFDLYNQLLDSSDPSSEEHSDILTNLQASQKHIDFINTDYLRALDGLSSDVTGSLEQAPPPLPPVLSHITSLGVSAPENRTGDTEREPAPVKRVRARRMPKGVVPGVTPPPDPERWLKKSERSTFQQGRGKRKGGGGATQGVVETAGGSSIGGHSRSGGHGRGGKRKK